MLRLARSEALGGMVLWEKRVEWWNLGPVIQASKHPSIYSKHPSIHAAKKDDAFMATIGF